MFNNVVRLSFFLLIVGIMTRITYSQEFEALPEVDIDQLLEQEGLQGEIEEFSDAAPANNDSQAYETITDEYIDVSSETVDLEPAAPSDYLVPLAEEDIQVETTQTPSETIDYIQDSNIPEMTTENNDLTVPQNEFIPASATDKTASEEDDLDSLKSDIREMVLPDLEIPQITEEKEPKVEPLPPLELFNVGIEEKELLELAKNIQGQIPQDQWNEVALASQTSTYTVVKNDWLFKISKKLFGSGYYYPKIWSLNTFIMNPHFIEPGMILTFTTGSDYQSPDVRLGNFDEDEMNKAPGTTTDGQDLMAFGDNAQAQWLDEKEKLKEQGVYFQYSTPYTQEDLNLAAKKALNKEYEIYTPPVSDFEVVVPKNYDDKTGFDKSSRIFYGFKEGFFLSTFISTNIVQDFGHITDGPDENTFFRPHDRAFVKFDETFNVIPGDKFSVYSAGGKTKHKNSDREGYKYTILAQIQTIQKIDDKWEVEFFDVSGTPQRADRITVYTPKPERVTQTFSSRIIEAAIISGYEPLQSLLSFGDVVYLDRGRADGLELGNVLEVFDFKDRNTKKKITYLPTYKTGELTIITLTDNFATALVTQTKRDFYVGDIAITKTKDAAMKSRLGKTGDQSKVKDLGLEELDVQLNLSDLNEDLLKQADKYQLTEDELAELERQEREKSVIKDSERDLKTLERLERELEDAESILNDAKLDEDKLLETSNLDELEKKQNIGDQEAINEIEENMGKRYMDENLNSKDNPYGLTDFDIEEVDELLNIEQELDE